MWILNVVGKYRGPLCSLRSTPQLGCEAGPVKDVVAQYEANRILANKVLAQDKRLRQAIRILLNCVLDTEAPLAPISQKVGVSNLITGCGDDQNIPNASLHQRGERVINHRLVVYRHQLLADSHGQWMQARARSTGKNDALICGVLSHDGRISPRGAGVYRPLAHLASHRRGGVAVLGVWPSIIWRAYCH